MKGCKNAVLECAQSYLLLYLNKWEWNWKGTNDTNIKRIGWNKSGKWIICTTEPAYYNRQKNNVLLTWHISRQKKKNMFPDRRFCTSWLLKVYWGKNWKKVLKHILFSYWNRALVKFGHGGDTSKIIRTASLWESCYVYVNPVHGKYLI